MCESLQNSRWKCPKRILWENFGHKLDSNYWQANMVFWQTIRRLRDKRSHTARSTKDQNVGWLSNERDILGRWPGVLKEHWKSGHQAWSSLLWECRSHNTVTTRTHVMTRLMDNAYETIKMETGKAKTLWAGFTHIFKNYFIYFFITMSILNLISSIPLFLFIFWYSSSWNSILHIAEHCRNNEVLFTFSKILLRYLRFLYNSKFPYFVNT